MLCAMAGLSTYLNMRAEAECHGAKCILEELNLQRVDALAGPNE